MAVTSRADQPVFKKAFDPKTQNELLDEDHFAWKSVCTVLIAIVCMGLVIGIVGVTFSLLNS